MREIRARHNRPCEAPYGVLIVDDHVLVAEALAYRLRDERDLVVRGLASTLDDAVPLTARQRPAVVLLDSELAWHDVRRRMDRLLRAAEGVNVVFLDETVTESRARRALAAGARGYVSKADTLKELIAALRRAARGRYALSPRLATCDGLVDTAGAAGSQRQAGPLGSLTDREMDVLVHLAMGQSVKQCAAALALSPSTVDNHKSRLMKKLDVHKTVQLLTLAIREGLLPVQTLWQEDLLQASGRV